MSDLEDEDPKNIRKKKEERRSIMLLNTTTLNAMLLHLCSAALLIVMMMISSLMMEHRLLKVLGRVGKRSDLGGESDSEAIPETRFEDEPMDKFDDINSIPHSKPYPTYPPGFTPNDNAEDNINTSNVEPVERGHNGDKEEEEFVVSQNQDINDTDVDANESTCSGHFKKSTGPRTGGSIIQLIEDLVNVGQTMGYDMMGCMKNIENIIESQGGTQVAFFVCGRATVFKKDYATISDNFVAIYGTWLPSNSKVLFVAIYAPQQMVYRGKTCWVRAIEAPGWVPDFEDDCDDDDFESNYGTQPVERGHNGDKEEGEFVVSQNQDRIDTDGWGNFNFDYVYSEAVGQSGGILSVWDPTKFQKLNHTISYYCTLVRGVWVLNGRNLLIISIYAPQELSEKRTLWDYLCFTICNWDGDVVTLRDFNEVRDSSERFGSVSNKHGAKLFNDFIAKAGLTEVPLGGCIFTWCHKTASKMSKLDRFLVSDSLLFNCPSISSVTLD
nr:RNA-directed DNA polymerase, eukaryota [Tanacetum cinerariifolium]